MIRVRWLARLLKRLVKKKAPCTSSKFCIWRPSQSLSASAWQEGGCAMSNDCHQYKCWFPELGQRLKKAREFVGSNSSEAAQEAVSFKCWNDAEFRDHIVAVQKDGSNVVEQFDVKLRSIPSFTAHLIYPEAGETVR